MPSISKIRFTNVIYDNGQKRFNDDIFRFDGNNGAIILENGGGKTVFIQCAVQAVLPHADLGDRKIKETLNLDNTCCHIGIEWIIKERPRQYCVTAVSLFKNPNGDLASYRFVNEYDAHDKQDLENMPFVKEIPGLGNRPATKEEIAEYYNNMKNNSMSAHTFQTHESYHTYLENNIKVIPSEWRSILAINRKEGGVEEFFDNCATTGALVDNLLIPSIEEIIAGDNEKGFTKTFEEQRDAFKEHRKLTRHISEYDKTIVKLNAYLSSYQKLHDAKMAFLSVMQEAKALYALVKKDKADITQKSYDIQQQQAALAADAKQLVFKQTSLRIAKMKRQCDRIREDYNLAVEKANAKRSLFHEKRARKENIELLNQRNEIEEIRHKILVQEDALKRLDAETGMEELTALLSDNGQYLRGVYVAEEELLTKQLTSIHIELRKLEDEHTEKKRLYDETDIKIKRLLEDIGKQTGILEINHKRMEVIATKILANPKSQTVAEELERYNKRAPQIEQDKAEWQSQINQATQRINHCRVMLPVERDEQKKADGEYAEIKNKLAQLDDEIAKLTERLHDGYRDFYAVTADNFYVKEQFIKNSINNYIEEKTRQKEALMTEERFAKRQLDMYGDSPYFTADPSVVSIIKSVANQFSYILSGTEFVQETHRESNKTYEELLESYPFWVATIIINDNELAKFTAVMERHKNKLNTNLFLLTYTQAMQLVNGEKQDIAHIRPIFWDQNIDATQFTLWKTAVDQNGKLAEERRKEKETELIRLQTDKKDFHSFFVQYSCSTQTQWKEQWIELRSRCDESEKKIKAMEEDVTHAEKSMALSLTKMQELDTEYNHIMYNRSLAMDYIKTQKENEETSRSLDVITAEKERLEKEARKIRQAIDDLDYQIEDSKYRKGEKERAKDRVENEPFYQDVRHAGERYGNKNKQALIDEREKLQAELNQRQEERSGIEKNLIQLRKDLVSNEAAFRRKKAEGKYHFDESQTFHESIILELDPLIQRILEIETELHPLEKKERKLEIECKENEGVYNDHLKRFQAEYGELLFFSMSLSEAHTILQNEEIEISNRRALLNELHKKTEADLSDVSKAGIEMDKLDAAYKFLHEATDAVYDKETDFYYNRLQVISSLGERLSKRHTHMQTEQTRINKEKDAFIAACHTDITDIRLRENVMDSIERNTDYEALKEAYKRTIHHIDQTKLMNQDYLKAREDSMQQYILQLYTHVERIAKELSVIQHKTKVKTDTGTKEIFEIKVPVWDDMEAKRDLQNHIHWILEQIEQQSKFKDEAGIENHSEIKKFIEKSLRTKQLFQKIFKNANIKIKTRKVTSDNQVSSRFYTWEESEKWSGGERWSKNMTLYLGILNYIAEKRQANMTGAQYNRCVILDNPFGKASSEHVLDPVFYIARELGFQIIAVTAHAEGKFIHDYFPIVYSLRLREAEGGGTSIMTKTFAVKHAYFKDRNPVELDRLLKREQIRLDTSF